ncbi:MAG: ArsR/SmtB family transcription factor [Polymorphobacter sp.]|uniref:ArsR/SmtB family transcription factor n=1 Tax=Polymorphobacter sp. TaxID=1909290 RepID=UPI003A859228
MTERLAERAEAVSRTLKLMANDQRLLLLCRLRQGECAVGELVDAVGVSQSSVSQHLARLREGGMVKARRAANNIFYSTAGPKIDALIDQLCDHFAGGEST